MQRTEPGPRPDRAGPPEAPRHWQPPPPGARLRGALLLAPVALLLVISASLVGLGALALRGPFRRRVAPLARLWGRFALAAFGVRLETSGREHIAGAAARIVLFNHVSLLDVFVLAATSPDRPVFVYKREFHRIPGVGLALRALGMIPIDRSDRESAIASLRAAGERIRRHGETVLMAPEGTRSRPGGLLPFKLGPFHLAVETRVPIVPMILRGVAEVMPLGTLLVRPGVVRVDWPPPIDTSEWSHERVREHAESTRALMLRYLPPAPGT